MKHNKHSKTLGSGEFEEKIKGGEIPEHPAWEDLIELKNLEAEIKEIDRDIKSLRAA